MERDILKRRPAAIVVDRSTTGADTWFRQSGLSGLRHYLTLLSARTSCLRSDIAILHARVNLQESRSLKHIHRNPVEIVEDRPFED